MCLRVLIIDDEAIVRETLSYLLTDFGGYDVIAVRDEIEAADALRTCGLPDVVIVDYWLQGTSGIKVYDRLVAQAARAIPAVLLSGSIADVEAEAARREMAFMRKPVRVAELVMVINNLLERRAGDRALSARQAHVPDASDASGLQSC